MLTRKHPHARDLLRRHRFWPKVRMDVFCDRNLEALLDMVMEHRVLDGVDGGTPFPASFSVSDWRTLLQRMRASRLNYPQRRLP